MLMGRSAINPPFIHPWLHFPSYALLLFYKKNRVNLVNRDRLILNDINLYTHTRLTNGAFI